MSIPEAAGSFFLDTFRLISDKKAAIDDGRGFANCYVREGRQLEMSKISILFFSQVKLIRALQAASEMTLPFYVVSEVL